MSGDGAPVSVDQSPALSTTGLRFLPPRSFPGKDYDLDILQYMFNAYMKLAHPKLTKIFKIAQEAGSSPLTCDEGIEEDELALSY